MQYIAFIRIKIKTPIGWLVVVVVVVNFIKHQNRAITGELYYVVNW